MVDWHIRLYEWLEKAIEPLREFIINNQKNPLLWIGLFFGVLAIAMYVYNELRKEK